MLLALPGFEPGILLVDDIDPAFAADDAAVLVTLLERAEGIANFHGFKAFDFDRKEARNLLAAGRPVNPVLGSKKGRIPGKIHLSQRPAMLEMGS
jgi:hypothetical protein